MGPFTTLYERLRQRADGKVLACIQEPPLLKDWLRFWGNGNIDLCHLRNLEHWLSRRTSARTPLKHPPLR